MISENIPSPYSLVPITWNSYLVFAFKSWICILRASGGFTGSSIQFVNLESFSRYLLEKKCYDIFGFLALTGLNTILFQCRIFITSLPCLPYFIFLTTSSTTTVSWHPLNGDSKCTRIRHGYIPWCVRCCPFY